MLILSLLIYLWVRRLTSLLSRYETIHNFDKDQFKHMLRLPTIFYDVELLQQG